MPDSTSLDDKALIDTVAGVLSAHRDSRTALVNVRTPGVSNVRTSLVTTCTCGVTTSDHSAHVAGALHRAGLVTSEQEARDGHPAGKGLPADETPPSRRTLLERLEDAEIDLASARTVQERARIAFEEANGNVGVAVWERETAADALIAHINGGAA